MSGRWRGGTETIVDCPFCYDKSGDQPGADGQGEPCAVCGDRLDFTCIGNADWRRFVDGASPSDLYLTARTFFWALDRDWSPAELSAQSAWWVQAYLFFEGYCLRLLEEARERARARWRVEHGGNQQSPGGWPNSP